MATVWQVYYNHWARENHQILERHSKTKEGIENTIFRFWCWLEMMPLDSDVSFQKCQKYLKNQMDIFVMVDSEEERFQILKGMADYLHPPMVDSRLPDDWEFSTLEVENGALERGEYTPYTYSPPVEKRFLENVGRRYHSNFGSYKTDRIRQLDAIIGHLPLLKKKK